MAQCIPGLNPPKTLSGNVFSSVSYCKTGPRWIKFLTMSSQQHQSQQLSLDALISSNRKEEVIGAVRHSLSNCLSETNLHLTVPALKSKTRGKVLVRPNPNWILETLNFSFFLFKILSVRFAKKVLENKRQLTGFSGSGEGEKWHARHVW